MTEKKINIIPMARAIREQGTVNPASSARSDIGSGDFLEKLDRIKPELYALTAVLINRIVTRAYNQRANRPPFGLIWYGGSTLKPENLDTYFPFSTTGVALYGTIAEAKDDEFEDIETGTTTGNIQMAYRRLAAITQELSLSRTVADPPVAASPSENIDGGIDFACTIISGIAEITPRLFPSIKDPKHLAEILRNSYPLVLKLASFNIEHVRKIMGTLTIEQDRFKHVPTLPILRREGFAPGGKGNRDQVIISQEGERMLSAAGIIDPHVGRGPTIGCPALINFGEGSAIKTMFDWEVAIAEKVYQMRFTNGKNSNV